jgi:hypothetical protein
MNYFLTLVLFILLAINGNCQSSNENNAKYQESINGKMIYKHIYFIKIANSDNLEYQEKYISIIKSLDKEAKCFFDLTSQKFILNSNKYYDLTELRNKLEQFHEFKIPITEPIDYKSKDNTTNSNVQNY